MCTNRAKQMIKYINQQWTNFTFNYMRAYGKHCASCCMDKASNKLYHLEYKQGKNLYDYKFHDCIIICDDCNDKLHTVEPKEDWILIKIEDLAYTNGCCQKIKDTGKVCNQKIKTLYHVYHPAHGYKVVGSSCIEMLNSDDKQRVKVINSAILEINKIASKDWIFKKALQTTNDIVFANKDCYYIEIVKNKKQLVANNKFESYNQTFFIKLFKQGDKFCMQIAKNYYQNNFIQKNILANSFEDAKKIAALYLLDHVNKDNPETSIYYSELLKNNSL